MLKLIIAVLFLVAGIIEFKFGFLVIKRRVRTEEGMSYATFKRWSRLASWACIGLGILTIAFSTFRVVPAGFGGVATLFGKVQPEVLSEGLNVVNPLINVNLMDGRIQKLEGKFDAASRDMQDVHVVMTLNYRIVLKDAPDIYQRVGHRYDDIIIAPAAQEVLKAVTALHPAVEILQKRPEIKADVQDRLNEWLSKYSVNLREVALANISFDPEYEKAISDKQVEEQRAKMRVYMLDQARKDAEIAAAKAKGEGDAARERANGQADAKRILGKGEADYNTRVSRSLSPILIQQMYYEKWNGVLPVYMMGNSTPLIQIPTTSKHAAMK